MKDSTGGSPGGQDKTRKPKNLVEVLDAEDTKRITPEMLRATLRAESAGAAPLEPRDYRPVRRSRVGKLGCLGGLMYAVFVISISVILACVAWMFACDVLALNKEEGSAEVYLPKDIFSMTKQEGKDDDGKVTGTREVETADMDYVADALKDAGIIRFKSLFKLFARISHADTKLDPGTYVLTTEMDYRALIKNMQVGTASMIVTKLTFP